jgi:transposase
MTSVANFEDLRWDCVLLLRHPRFHLHFTPTSSSWLNLAERWFAELTNRNSVGQRTAASPNSKLTSERKHSAPVMGAG